jgi:hypothetical protein
MSILTRPPPVARNLIFGWRRLPLPKAARDPGQKHYKANPPCPWLCLDPVLRDHYLPALLRPALLLPCTNHIARALFFMDYATNRNDQSLIRDQVHQVRILKGLMMTYLGQFHSVGPNRHYPAGPMTLEQQLRLSSTSTFPKFGQGVSLNQTWSLFEAVRYADGKKCGNCHPDSMRPDSPDTHRCSACANFKKKQNGKGLRY